MLTHNINVPIDGGYIESTIHKPPEARVIVLISHAPGSGCFNVRNRQLADQLSQAGFATLLCDWTKVKEMNEHFDHFKMAQSLASVVRWLKSHRSFKDLSPVFYGTGTGAVFSLIAASQMDDSIKAVVSRNGRLEIAKDHLHKVKSPTLIAVGEKDYHLLESNRKAYEKLGCKKRLVIMPGITPFFEEPKKVERIGRLSIDWILKHSLPQTITPDKKTTEIS